MLSVRPARTVLLVATLAVASSLRLTNLTWGLPDFWHPDEWNHFAVVAERADRDGFREARPLVYTYPPWHALSLGLVLRATRATGIVDCPRGPIGTPSPCTLLIGRIWTVLLGILTVAVVYLAGRTWLSPPAALASAAALAVAPFHVLYSHLTNPDVPLAFWMTMALACGLRAAQHRGWLAASAFLAGLAAATKFPGVFALGPALAAVALRFRQDRREAWKVAALVGASLAVGLLVGCPRCPRDALDILTLQRVVARVTMVEGWPGTDLFPGSIVGHRYVYQLAAVLPYSLGWPLYALGMLGVLVLAAERSWPRTVMAATALPFLLFMGAARVAPPRFYLPLLPVLSLCAGALFERWVVGRGRGRRLAGVLAFAVAVGYSALLSASLVAQVDFSRQRAVAAWLTERARSSPPLTVGYPDRWLWDYDGAVAIVEPGTVRWLFMPAPNAGREPQYDAWYGRTRPDLLLWPSFQAKRVCRNYPGGSACRFLGDLDAGRLGYRLVETFETSYPTESLYTALDPMFGTLSEVGLMSYRIFERVE